MTVAVIIIYMCVVVAIGLMSHRIFRGTGEDYFVASRSIGPFILLMSLFGTHMTAFAILGASGEAYHRGVGVFALMASSSAFVVPVVFFFVGTRVWRLGKRHGFVTQVAFFRARWQSEPFGLLLFVVLVALMVPYLLIGVMGAGLTMNQITDGQVPQWLGGLMVCAAISLYVCSGGVRGTAWVNTFQTLVFGTLGAVAFIVIASKMGGLSGVVEQLAQTHPQLLLRGEAMPWLKVLSYTFIPLSVGMFPHMFMHWLTAEKASTFKATVIYYPVCVAVVWVPSVLLGVMGVIDFPGLQGPEANSVLVRMVGLHAPGVLGALLAAGVFAAIMSSLDSQSLSMGTMFTCDIVRHYGFKEQMSQRGQVIVGRIFVLLILAITYGLSLVVNRSIFKLGIWSFSGFAGLIPLVIAALYWRRSTRAGAYAGLLTATALWILFFVKAQQVANYTVLGSGLMPVVVITLASGLAMVAVSLVTRPPDADHLRQFGFETGTD